MSGATFEDFAQLAEARMQRAALQITDGARVSNATLSALAEVTRALTTLSTRYGTLANFAPAVGWQPAFTTHLRDAAAALRHHTPSSAATPTDELIRDAAHYLIIGRDLLATHETGAEGRAFPRTPHGEQLHSPAVREHLLGRAAELTGTLATLTGTVRAFAGRTSTEDTAYRPRGRDMAAAAAHLADAAALGPGPTGRRLRLTPAIALSAAIDYPSPGEDPQIAAGRIDASLTRLSTAGYRAAARMDLGDTTPAHTATDLRETATSLALAHVLAADLLTHLSPHLPAHPALDPPTAAARLREAGAAWATVRRNWQHTVSVPEAGPRSPLATEARSVPLRLGRLLYDDETWTTRDGPGRPRPPEQLADPAVLAALCDTLGALPAAAATIAEHHARLITESIVDLHSSARAHRPGNESRRFYPLQGAQRAEAVAGYRSAGDASRRAAAGVQPLGWGYEALAAVAAASFVSPEPGRAARAVPSPGRAASPQARSIGRDVPEL